MRAPYFSATSLPRGASDGSRRAPG